MGGRTTKIVFRRRILLIALLVGFCSSVSAEAAIAPVRPKPLTLLTASPKTYAYGKVMNQWGSHQQYKCLVELWERESHWNPKAENKKSGAYGIAQFMPSTWANYKAPHKPKEAGVQITFGLRYITKRYGSPCEAWAFWQKQAKKGNPWY